jgi:hypothetical protein
VSPAAVEQQISALRAAKVTFRDTVPALQPPLSSPCDL